MKTILPPDIKQRAVTINKRSIINASLAGLVFCSVCIVSQAADSRSVVNTPSYTIKIIKVDKAADTPISKRPVSEPAKTPMPDAISKPTVQAPKNITGTLIDSTQRTIRLSNGGVVWVSNDPVALTPTLNVSTSKDVNMDGNQFEKPLSFTLSTNYAAFIKQWEVRVFKDSDEDQRNPLVILSGKKIINGQTVKWDGKTSDGSLLKAGDNLRYLLIVKDANGYMDKTYLKSLTLQGPGRNILEEDSTLARNTENSLDGTQTIPLDGARVRIFGNDIGDNQTLTIDDEKVSVAEGKFVVERILPEGPHHFNVEINDGNKSYTQLLNTQVDGKYLFMVGIADVTVGEGKVTGNLESLSDGDKYLDGDIFVDGRLAFYLKGKIRGKALGKYLVTAQMDTGTAGIDELFDDIHKKDPQSLFRRIDPDKYYPVYGDDSTLVDDTNSQGKMYVRIDWDKSQAVWGNFNTNITGTELSAFNRSLYGAKLNRKSTQITKDGKHKTDLTLFASEVQSAFRHNQFLGTGGSLYYLKDTDVVDGSEKVWVEVRERNGDRVIEQVVMQAGRDYEIDDFQGRIILHRPLLQIAEQSNPSLVKDNPLDGNQVYLMVDYEYVPDDFDADKASYGVRGKTWLNDHFAVGGTYVHENRSDNDYDLKGVDITLEKAKGTYIVAEYAETEALQSQGSFFSEDGGLNFGIINNPAAVTNVKGSAYSVEARANLEDLINKSGSLGAWYKHRDAGFSTARLEQGEETVDSGIEAIINVNDKLKLSTKATVYDQKDSRKLSTASIQGDYTVNDALTLSAEVRRVKEEGKSATVNTIDSEGTLAAFKVGYDINNEVNVYLIGQSTLSETGNYQSNDLVTLGTKAKLNSKLDLVAEFSTGDRGEAATLGMDYQYSNDHTFYSNYTLSKESITERNLLTVGQRKTVTDRLKVFTEHQFTRETLQHGLGNSFGIDYNVTDDLLLNASLQTASLEQNEGGTTDRNAFSVGLSYNKDNTTGSSRLEYRRDKGDDIDTEQWISTNRINYRINPSLRLQGKFNYSETRDQLGNTRDAKFVESGMGFALRPTNNDRLNVLGRLTYLYDLQPSSQSNNTDEKALVASLETDYQIDQKWQVGGKIAHKQGEIRSDRDAGDWEKNDATLAAVRARYHLSDNWDAMAQYHWMNSDESQDTQHGAMVSVDRHIGKNIKIGVGYNFTDFDDDLTNLDGNAKGWFINLVGKF